MMPVEKVGNNVDERKMLDEGLPKDEDKKEEEEEEVEEEVEEVEEEEPEEKEEEKEEEQEDSEEVEALVDDNLYQKLKKESPDLLKKIPELRSVIFREMKYTEIFPSINDARDASEALNVLGSFESNIKSGESKKFLESVKDLGDDSFDNFLSGFTESLYSLSKDKYIEFMAPEFKRMLKSAAKHTDERIANAAANIHYFLFENTNFDEEVGLKSQKKDSRFEELDKREKEIQERQFNSFRNDVHETASKRLMHRIEKPLADMGLPPIQVKLYAKEIFQRVNDVITKDTRHMSNINRLWDKAGKDGYTTAGKDSIISTFLSRASVLIPTMRSKVLSEAKVSGKGESKDKKEAKRVPSSGSFSKSGLKPGEKLDISQVDMSKTSERDLLDGKFVLKK